MGRIQVWTLVGVSLLLTGCGGAVTVNTSPRPSQTTPSPKQQLAVYMHKFNGFYKRQKVADAQFSRSRQQLHHLQSKDVLNFVIGLRTLAHQYAALSTAVTASNPPQCASFAIREYAQFLRDKGLSIVAFSNEKWILCNRLQNRASQEFKSFNDYIDTAKYAASMSSGS